MLWEGSGLWIERGLGIAGVVEWAGLGGRIARPPRVVPKAPPCEPTRRSAKVLHGASPQRITVVLGAFGDAKAINGPPRREANWATTLHSACGASDNPLS